MAEDKQVMDTGSEAMEGSATVVQGLSNDDDGAGNFFAVSATVQNAQWTSSLPPAENQRENSVEALAEEGYRQVGHDVVVVPTPTTAAGGSVGGTQPSDELPQSDDSLRCSTPTDDPQMPDGMLEMSLKRMMSYIRSPREIDIKTGIILYRGEYQNQKVEIKQYPEMHMRDFLKVREMAYLRNPFILPVLGYTMSRMVMYPHMVRGDLTKVCLDLGWSERLQILYQLSASIALLHCSKPGVRAEICHRSINAESIYVDQNLNARIGDFSEAIELRKKSASPSDMAKDDARKKKDDIYSLARVALFLLTSTEVTGCLPLLPKASKMVSCKKYWDMEIWKHVPKETRKTLARLIILCSKKRITAPDLEINLKDLLISCGIPMFNLPEGRSNYCINCCINIQDNNPVPVPTSEFCPDACPSRRFCRTCYQTSYRNTLYCPDHGPLKDKIPKKDVYAILLSGFETDQLKQDIFDRDVESMSNVITDPRIMGLSDGNIFQISHNSADKLKKLHDAVKYLKTKTVHTLIFYYSGHGKRGRHKSVDEDNDEDGDEDDDKEGYDKDDGEFYCLYNRDNRKENYEKDYSDEDDDKDHVPFLLIGEKRTGITDRGLRKLLTPFTKTSILVIMDCCFAARYKVLPEIRDKEPHPQIFRVQFNGTGSSNFGQMSSRINSLFTCCLLRAMEGGFRCPPFLCDASKCKEGIYFQRSAAASGYISLADCHKFITRHMECWNADSNFVTNGILDDVAIARYRDTPLGVFKYDIRGLKGMLNVYQLQDIPDDMLQQLWDEIGSMYGRSSRRHQLPKNLDFRCLKLVVPGSRGEREIQKKREVTHQCCKGHIIRIRLRSASQDLDQDRCVVCFYCDHNRFKEVLDKIQFCYKGFFTSPENTEMGQAAVIDIKLAEEPGLSELQSVYWDYERNDFMGLIVTSLTRAYEMARNNQNILGLRISITPNLATLELEIKKQ